MLLGVSHHDLELTDLQRMSAGADQLAVQLVAATSVTSPEGEDDGPIKGAVVVATCNRIEIYVEARRFHDAVDRVAATLAAAAGMPNAAVAAQLKVRVGAPVAAHLFAVAAGLDSMVVGEAEISGQVARALRRAQLEATASPVLNQLFQRASRTAKRVHSQTHLGAAGRSVASVALDAAAETGLIGAGAPGPGGTFAGQSALIIGTGSYARVVATALRARDCTDLHVYSPSGRADSFAETHSARPVGVLDLPTVLKGIDLVVACSGTTGSALTVDMIHASGREQPLPVIDLALRSDLAPEVRALPQVLVIDLYTVSAHAPGEQADALTAAQDLVIAAVADFEDSQAIRALDPAVVALRSHVSDVVAREMDRLRAKYDEAVALELEQAMHRVTRSMLHTPTMRAQELARSGNGAGYVAALHTLFGIDLGSAPD